MKYRNKETGVVIEPRSDIMKEQLAKDTRFEEYTGKTGEKPVEKMNKAELLAKATELGLSVPEGATNPDIVNLIKGAAGQ